MALLVGVSRISDRQRFLRASLGARDKTPPPDASSDLDRPLRSRHGWRWPIQIADASPSPLQGEATAEVAAVRLPGESRPADDLPAGETKH